MAIGAVTLWTLARIGLSGAAAVIWTPATEGGAFPIVGDWRVSLLGGPSSVVTWGLLAVALVGASLVAVGLWTRAAALATGQASIALFSLLPMAGGGHDRLLTNALWLLVLSPSDASLSLSTRLRTGRWIDPTPRPAIGRFLAILQICVVYTATSWAKLGAEWWPWGGLAAVYRSLLAPSWARYDLSWIAAFYPATQAMTAVTLLWEGTFWVVGAWLLLRRRWPRVARHDPRLLDIFVGVCVHGTLELAMNLGPFAWATLAFYPCLFRADEYAAFARAISSWAASDRRAPA
jgi:hypothetical protein